MDNQGIELIVHGGAWDIPDQEWAAHQRGVKEAYRLGYKILEQGGNCLDAVNASVRYLEDDPTFDAAKGSFLNRAGEVELDAGVMRGKDLAVGAVGVVKRFSNPVLIATRLLQRGQEALLVGEGAESFALEQGFEPIDPKSLIVPRESGRFEDFVKGTRSPQESFGGDTVAAMARDAKGSLAVATSTGGAPYTWPGRLGDTPLVGCGFYADDRYGAATITGHGEMSMRLGLARLAVEWMAQEAREDPLSAQRVADRIVAMAVERLDAKIGILTLSNAQSQAWVGAAHSTPRMAFLGKDRQGW